VSPSGFPVIEADVTFLPAEEGGRKYDLDLRIPRGYRPHIVIEDPGRRRAIVVDGVGAEDYLGVEFCEQDLIVHPGQTARVSMALMYFPALQYECAIPPATFTVREGAAIVAYGTIVGRVNP
jgi:hypothetical protein